MSDTVQRYRSPVYYLESVNGTPIVWVGDTLHGKGGARNTDELVAFLWRTRIGLYRSSVSCGLVLPSHGEYITWFNGVQYRVGADGGGRLSRRIQSTRFVAQRNIHLVSEALGTIT